MSNNWRERAKAKATPAQLAVLRAKEDDAKDVRRMMRNHPTGCPCYDCLWSPEECGETAPRVARTAVS